MRNLTRLVLVYLLNELPHLFIANRTKNSKSISVAIPQSGLYYLALHLRLSTVWYSTQLMELFSYNLPTKVASAGSLGSPLEVSDSVVSYNFHNMGTQERLFIFTWEDFSREIPLKSIANLFANAAWLERELGEMTGISFGAKEDLRNLMLPYGDVTSPLRKSFPSVGLKEIFYDVNNDMLVQAPNSLQV